MFLVVNSSKWHHLLQLYFWSISYVYQIKSTCCKGMSELFEREWYISKYFNTGDHLFSREKTIRGYQFSLLSTHTGITFFIAIAWLYSVIFIPLNLLVNATFKKWKSFTWNVKRNSKANRKYNKNEKHISERKIHKTQFPSK